MEMGEFFWWALKQPDKRLDSMQLITQETNDFTFTPSIIGIEKNTNQITQHFANPYSQ